VLILASWISVMSSSTSLSELTSDEMGNPDNLKTFWYCLYACFFPWFAYPIYSV
jgi:hypothetical protein